MKSLFGINLGGGNCEICDSVLNALNSCRVEKKFICKKCMSNVSRFFNKKNTSYETMIEHINYRIQNKEKIETFFPTVSYGENELFLIDTSNGNFVISLKSDYKEENPDIFSIADIVSCEKRSGKSK